MKDYQLRRFLEKVEEDDESGCWVWVGYIDEKGRGSMHIGRKYEYCHRIAYEHYIGPIPEGEHVHHTCGNKLCVNPDHLQTATPLQHTRLHRQMR